VREKKGKKMPDQRQIIHSLMTHAPSREKRCVDAFKEIAERHVPSPNNVARSNSFLKFNINYFFYKNILIPSKKKFNLNKNRYYKI